MERRQLLTGIGGLATVSVAGCLSRITGGDQGTTAWYDFTEAQENAFEDYLEEFNDGREDELNAEAPAEMEEELETALPAEQGPETFNWAHDWIGQYHEQEFVYDASDDLEIDLEETYTENAVEAVQWEGAIYGLPYAIETVSLMYNPEYVDEPPETLSEMVEIMEDHHDPENNQYGLSMPAVDPYFPSAWLQAFGGYLFDEETEELGIEDDEFIEGIELLEDSIWPYVPGDPDYDSQVPVFNDGNAPFAINGPWELEGFRDAGVDVEVAPLPDVEGGEPTPYTGVQVWYFTSELAAADQEELETTVEWAEWYTTNEEAIVDNAEMQGLIPVHQDYAEGDDNLGEDVETFAETVEMGTPLPTHPKSDQIWDPLEEGLERVFHGDESADEAMETAAEDIRDRWD
ncbi:extracellular solute-binding protein [Halostagnicola sp. A-GB9-2]|uniref:extracellular solute-binding protein n=1 Tax=Halostagnicola sp. A-GB9-2 TaxID=3048066 RepID=UPI0024BFF278|nr:extracellular solute-binding protein [Halostagnicola sp. A-GB9-2]MDJ1431293.1 extracellular solute-binding protein [Halostagnicola sp. A-GB9-2]